jgi:hypothetical protein
MEYEGGMVIVQFSLVAAAGREVGILQELLGFFVALLLRMTAVWGTVKPVRDNEPMNLRRRCRGF